MTTDSIFLVDADGDCEELVSSAAGRLERRIRWVRTAGDAFRGLHKFEDGLELIIVDLDPGAHGLALLEAIGSCSNKPPVIVLTSLEETYMKPIAQEHGAAACLGKPLSVEKLASVLQKIFNQRSTCDSWGHLLPWRRVGKQSRYEATRGIATKLSAANGAPNQSRGQTKAQRDRIRRKAG